MNTAATHDVLGAPGHGSHGHNGHDPHLAHHFDTPEQQMTSAKLGMWVFLATEILMFGGLFCAYSIYRAMHPDVFKFGANNYLDTRWGALNTVILITSSLTMAWGVRAAQLGQKVLLCFLLFVTILGGFGFMIIKGIEYHHKWTEHVWIGQWNRYNAEYKQQDKARPEAAGAMAATSGLAAPKAPAIDASLVVPDGNAGSLNESKIKPHFAIDGGLKKKSESAGQAGAVVLDEEGHIPFDSLSTSDKERVSTFFSVYFLMTGLHGIHVLIGMGLISWILIRSLKGEFGPNYFTPVDLVGLYWHLVDLIWIFLFPLLYLIK
jgi:cytochrome c oxidase subunit 3